MRSKDYLRRRIDMSYKKYEWTKEQIEVFEKLIAERYANYKKPENTLRSYLDLLNLIVEKIKSPFSEMTYDDLVPLMAEWQKNFASATLHGRKCKLKAFLRWESGNKHDPRAEKIRSGTYVSPVTIHDLLTESEIQKLRKIAKLSPRNIAMLDFHLLWGPRPAESAQLKIGDVKVTDNYIVINIPQTKTTSRPVPIPLASVSTIKDVDFLDSALNAYASLMRYLTLHPGFPNNPEYPLWYDERLGPTEALTKENISQIFRILGKKAKLSKPVSTYTLRRTAFNRFKGVDRERLCVGFGWKPGSKMPTTVYNKLRPQEYLETLIEEEPRERNVQICSQCGKENPADKVFCVFCSNKLVELPIAVTLEQFRADQEAQQELETLRDKMEKIEEVFKVLTETEGFDDVLKKAKKKLKK